MMLLFSEVHSPVHRFLGQLTASPLPPWQVLAGLPARLEAPSFVNQCVLQGCGIHYRVTVKVQLSSADHIYIYIYIYQSC